MESEDAVAAEPEVRRTRSGRAVRPPAAAKPASKKTRKKMVLVEVEVSDEDEEHAGKAENATSDSSQLETTMESVVEDGNDVSNTAEEFDNPKEAASNGDASTEDHSNAMEVSEKDDKAVENDHFQNSEPQVEATSSVLETNGVSESKDGQEMDVDVSSEPYAVAINKKEENVEESTEREEDNAEEMEVVEKEQIAEGEVAVAEIKEVVEEPDVEIAKNQTVDSEVVDNETVDNEKTSSEVKKPEAEVDPDAENISDEELPAVQVAKVPETEEVSDEELPGPKRAELPADTEIVSEDELPTVKKESGKRKLEEGDYDPTSPTSEVEGPAKKPALDGEAVTEKEEKVAKPKKLPELDKYWKPINDDPADFTGWTYLLQYVDQENDMEAAREAYDAFLSHYPYCYGYWRKYADYEKRKGNKKKCEEVFERGLKAIPLSVDLWIHYLTYVRTTRADDEDFIRSQYERALGACGLEFRSDRLWDSYIKWETEAKRLQNVTSIYDRLLAIPTQGYTTHFDNFQEHIASNPPNKVLEVDEFLALRKEVRHMLKHDAAAETSADNPDVPPGDEDSAEINTDEETKAIRERIVSIRRKIHKNTVNAVTARWNYEEGIKRPYFHVKPLERCQLKNWQEYLDFEIEQGDQTRTVVLFERCLIACALYDDFWLRYVHYLEGLKNPELLSKIRDVYERACTIHHLKKPNLHLQWAMFEESQQNFNKAAEILVNIEKSVPNVLQVAYRRINLERRRGENEKCAQLYEHYINNSKNKLISSNLAIKYGRFCYKICKNLEKALEILNSAIAKDPLNPRLYLQLIDLTLQKEDVAEKEILECIDTFLEKEGADADQKVLFAQRKLEFLEDFGSDIQCVQKAYDEYQKYIKQSKESGKKKESSKTDTSSSSKKDKNPPLPSSQSNSYSSYGSYGNSNASSYQYSGSQQGQYGYSQYGQGDQYQYQNWQYPQGGYGGYNQWGGYGGGYSY